jgi:thioredoxin reductase
MRYDVVIIGAGAAGFGCANKLEVDRVNNYFIISDNGRGMPIHLKSDPNNPSSMITSAEIASSRVNSGSKFYKKSSATGMNGIDNWSSILEIRL